PLNREQQVFNQLEGLADSQGEGTLASAESLVGPLLDGLVKAVADIHDEIDGSAEPPDPLDVLQDTLKGVEPVLNMVSGPTPVVALLDKVIRRKDGGVVKTDLQPGASFPPVRETLATMSRNVE